MDLDPDIPDDDAALEQLLRERRLGPTAPGDSNPWDFLRRWPDDVRRRRVWPIVSRLLIDDDAAVRARALESVEFWPDGIDVTAARVAEVGERRPELFGRDVVDDIALRDQYARTASMLSMYHEGKRFAAVLRRLAADGPLGGSAAAVIAEHDPQFVIAQTKAWGVDAGAWANAAAPTFAAYRRDELVDFLEAAVNLDVDTREQVLARVERAIKRDDDAARKSAASKRLPAPCRPAPTIAECRAAIGLH